MEIGHICVEIFFCAGVFHKEPLFNSKRDDSTWKAEMCGTIEPKEGENFEKS